MILTLRLEITDTGLGETELRNHEAKQQLVTLRGFMPFPSRTYFCVTTALFLAQTPWEQSSGPPTPLPPASAQATHVCSPWSSATTLPGTAGAASPLAFGRGEMLRVPPPSSGLLQAADPARGRRLRGPGFRPAVKARRRPGLAAARVRSQSRPRARGATLSAACPRWASVGRL